MAVKKLQFDYKLLTITLSLLTFGLIALFSASTVNSFSNFGNTQYYIIHQAVYGGVIGLILMYVCSKLDYHIWQKYLPLLIFASLFFLFLVKVPGIGISAGGASRWVHFGFFTFQPAELAKLVIIFYLASWVDKNRNELNNFYFGLLPSLCIVGLFAGLILWQPDFGTMLVLLLISFFMLFVAGINWKYFFYSAIIGFLSLYLIIIFEPYRAKRLTTFLNPSLDPKGIGYHINQALLAIGSGGWLGFGYGLSRQKHNYLPEVMTDSIFAVLAEEMGFIRAVLVLVLFLLFAIKGYSISKNAPDMFGRMVAFGITTWIIVQAFINIGAMLNFLPLTGIPLPFFSYGSTALIANLTGVGILLGISRYSNKAV